ATAVQHVVVGIAEDGLVLGIAGDVDAGVGCRIERQDFDRDPFAKNVVVGRGIQGVVALVCQFLHGVCQNIDIVGVVAFASLHRVGAAATVDDVVALVAADELVELVAGHIDVR
ncbi:unnamed protein product, partial [Phaeothamnion confervicola]